MNNDAPLDRLAADPGFLLSRVGAAIRDGFKDMLARWRIRPLQYLILLILQAQDGISQQELCAAAGVDSGNMVELLDGLEGLLYVERARDPGDRRRHIVTITTLGRSTAHELHKAVEEYNGRFLSPLTDSERDQLAIALGKLYVAQA
jgi:DNA-binding MarR family transcriptional regulator